MNKLSNNVATSSAAESDKSASHGPAHIEGLCDIVLNLKRPRKDFEDLLRLLAWKQKECAPYKGKILHHIQMHSESNPDIDLRLLSGCFAFASVLFRKTPNKNEGPLGAWKSSLAKELQILEANLNQLYSLAGVSTNDIIERDEDIDVNSELVLSSQDLDDSTAWMTHIKKLFMKVDIAAHNVCALISIPADFKLVIPCLVLLRFASKIGLLRLKDYNKKPSSDLKNYCYSLSQYLIEINLMMLETIITIISTNVIPYISFITQPLARILEWTRTSNLLKHDEEIYHDIRAKVFKKFSFIVEQLSLNINLEPKILSTMIEVELVDTLEELVSEQSKFTTFKDIHIVEAMKCLENLIIVYRDLLEPTQEAKVKNFVVQTSVKIYRNFESNIISPACRKQLLQLLVSIANQPFASSATEIAYHLLELAVKLERDPALKSMARMSLKLGLAHKPTIVSHYDVHNVYGLPMLSGEDTAEVNNGHTTKSTSSTDLNVGNTMLNQTITQIEMPEENSHSVSNPTSCNETEPMAIQAYEVEAQPLAVMEGVAEIDEPEPVKETEEDLRVANSEAAKSNLETNYEMVEADSEILSYMKHFVEKLA